MESVIHSANADEVLRRFHLSCVTGDEPAPGEMTGPGAC